VAIPSSLRTVWYFGIALLLECWFLRWFTSVFRGFCSGSYSCPQVVVRRLPPEGWVYGLGALHELRLKFPWKEHSGHTSIDQTSHDAEVLKAGGIARRSNKEIADGLYKPSLSSGSWFVSSKTFILSDLLIPGARVGQRRAWRPHLSRFQRARGPTHAWRLPQTRSVSRVRIHAATTPPQAGAHGDPWERTSRSSTYFPEIYF
jgi:hypothetical protein